MKTPVKRQARGESQSARFSWGFQFRIVNSETQRLRDTETQRLRDSDTQILRDSETQRLRELTLNREFLLIFTIFTNFPYFFVFRRKTEVKEKRFWAIASDIVLVRPRYPWLNRAKPG